MQLLLQKKVTEVFTLVGLCHKHPHGKTSTTIQRHQNGQFWNHVQSYFKVFLGEGTQSYSYIASIPKQSKPRRHLIIWLRILLKVLYLESIFRSSHISSSISALAMIVGGYCEDGGWGCIGSQNPFLYSPPIPPPPPPPPPPHQKNLDFFAPRSLRAENSLRGL